MNRIAWAAHTHQGGRPVNEDSWRVITEPIGCFVVADGLGGHGGGDIASAVVAEAVVSAASISGNSVNADAAAAMIAHAADALNARLQQCPVNMRSTLTVLITDGQRISWAWVGDTRLYRFRSGKACCLSRDHTVAGRLVASGELKEDQVRGHEDRSLLLRAIGSGNHISENGEEQLLSGDIYLLCTDGWWEPMTEAEMEQYLAKSSTPDNWLSEMEASLLARQECNSDNRTAVAVWAQDDSDKQ